MMEATHAVLYHAVREYVEDQRVVYQIGCTCGWVGMPAVAPKRAEMDMNEHLADPDAEPGLELGYQLDEGS